MLKSLAPNSVDGLGSSPVSFRRAGRLGWSGLISGFQQHLTWRAEHRRLLRAERQLEAMDDRMLKDIGIDRSEIGRIVRYGRRS
jgi:uncharacterized protein YjiS (DUF1127 family)